jgi:hypothetical protein
MVKSDRVRIGFVLFTLVLAAEAGAQDRTVRGRILDEASNAAVPGATVVAATVTATTAADGSYALTLPPGSWSIVVVAPGYLERMVPLRVESANIDRFDITIVAAPRFREQVDVTPDPAPPPAAARIPVLPSQVLSMAGTLDNVFRALQAMPGVAGVEDWGSRMSVRGGTPDQNLTIMDGVEISNPYRLYGLTSGFNPETIDRFELTAGGFGPQYGDRLSSLLVVENRQGSEARAFTGSAAVSLTDANVIGEGRLPGSLDGSWLLTGRRTYFDLVASKLVEDDLPKFGDIQFKTSMRTGATSRLSVLALTSREDTESPFFLGDTVEGRDLFLAKAKNDLVAVDYQLVPTWGSLRTIAAWYRNNDLIDIDARVEDDHRRSNAPPGDASTGFTDIEFHRTLNVQDFSLRQEIRFQPSAGHTIDAGIDVHRLRTGLTMTVGEDRNPTLGNGSSIDGGAGLPDAVASLRTAPRVGAWWQHVWRPSSRFRIEPGVRFDWSDANGELTVSPRMATGVRLGETELRFAGGLFTQSPGYEKLIQSDYFVDLSTPGRLALDHERAWHVIAGVERKLGWATTRVEGYYKRFDKLIVGRLETEAERQARIAQYDFPAELQSSIPREPIITSAATNDAKGDAYGVDVFTYWNASAASPLSGWASYTVGRARRDAYGQHYAFEYDRPQAANVAAAYRLKPSLTLAGTLRLASGFPWTPPLGVRVDSTADVTDIDGDRNREELVPRRDASGLLVYTVDVGGVSNLNSGRLPLYARLDLRLTWAPPGARWQLYADVINALNRTNAGRLDPKLVYDPDSDRPMIEEERAMSLPMLPSVGFRVRF